jgi:Ca-activated chloride channel family protein
VLKIALASRGKDEFGYRNEFVQLVRAAKSARTLAKLER